MDQHEHPDPFAGLEDWARKTERRVRREIRARGLRRMRVRVPARAARYLRLVMAFVIAGVLLAAAIPVLRSWMSAGVPAAYPTPAASARETVTTLRDTAPADPYAGTPAATYPQGEAGIALPEAAAVGGFTAAEVDSALRRTRDALIATRLAPGMLIGHQPEPFLAMLAPGQRDEIAARFRTGKFSTLATWIAPTARRDPSEPRVSGRATYAARVLGGVRTLEVTTNFIWVYAFQGADQPIAAVHDEIRWDFPAPGGRTMRVGAAKGYLAGADCAAAAKGMLAPAPRDELTIDYLRADVPVDIPADCP